jgi:hypothetical protein
MQGPIVLTGGGKFPFLDGVPQIITLDKFEDCCCPAPGSCPCGVWPNPIGPDNFPCGGLLYEYSGRASATKDSDPTGRCHTLAETIFPAYSDFFLFSCVWRESTDVYNCSISGNETKTVTVSLDPVFGGWTLAWFVGGASLRFGKSTGLSPVGIYQLLDNGFSETWFGWSGSAEVS